MRLDGNVPDEFVMELHPDLHARAYIGIPQAPLRGRRDTPVRIGVSAIDELLDRWQVTSLRRLDLGGDDGTSNKQGWPQRRVFVRVRTRPGSVDISRAMAALAARPDLIVGVERNRYRVTRQQPAAGIAAVGWGLEHINVREAWDLLTHRGSPDVKIAVLDTGCDVAHASLAQAWAVNGIIDLVDVTGDDAPDGWHWEGDFTGQDEDGHDEVGHGTHVAGIIAARDGDDQRAGVAPGCTLMTARVLGRLVHADGRVIGYGTSFDIAAGIDWATKQGAQLLNLSFAFSVGSAQERLALRRAVTKRIVPMAAMGNGGSDAGSAFPAGYPETVAVGAIRSNGQRWSGSQVGYHIDLMAPGVDVTSTRMGGGFEAVTGTSMACAFATGVAALVRSARPALGVNAVRQILQETALPGVTGPDEVTGWGTVDAAAAVRAALDS